MATGARRTARPVTPFLGDRQPDVRLPAGGRSSMPQLRSGLRKVPEVYSHTTRDERGQVRNGLFAGERWIRTIGSPPELNIRMEPGGGEARIQANARTFLPGAPEFTGETDSPLEGAGFELSIPRQS